MDAEISAGSFGRCPAAGESFRGGGGGVLPHKRLKWGCVAGWGCIFSTGVSEFSDFGGK